MSQFALVPRAFRRLCLVVFSLLAVGVAAAQSTTVVIDQVYGGGGSAAGTYNADFVELFNLSASPVDISGWSVQYASASNIAKAASTVVAIPSGTTLAPGQRYLVASTAGTGLADLPVTPDVTNSSLNMSATAGKVYLVNDSTAVIACPATGGTIVDAVGFGSTSGCFEGSAYAPAPSTTKADTRVDSCVDTDQNGTDFNNTSAPSPRNSQSTPTPCGAVVNPPTLASALATPSSVVAGNNVLFTVAATTGTNAISTVTADLSGIGGSATQAMHDDGTNGDVTSGDGIYSYKYAIPAVTAANTYSITFTATDTASLTGTASASLVVQSSSTTTPPSLSGAAFLPASVTSGDSTILSVTATPGSNPVSTGIAVTADLSAFGGSAAQPLYDDGTHGDKTANDDVFSYTLSVPSSQTAQAYTVNLSITDAEAGSGTSTAALTVQAPIAASSSVALSASTSSAVLGSPVSIVAVVTGNKSATPTGSVTFFDGSTQLGTGTATTPGTWAYTTSTLALGSHSITATYSGDGIYPSFTVPSSGAATVTITPVPVPDFAFSLANLSLIATTSAKTQVTTVNVTMTNGFNSSVSFACSGLPAGTRCTFSPTTLTASGSSVLTIGIDNAALHQHNSPFGKRGTETAVAFALLALPLALRRKRGWITGSLLGILLLGTLAFGTTGCGSDNATPNGTSTVTVTATGGGVTHTATLSLNVQ